MKKKATKPNPVLQKLKHLPIQDFFEEHKGEILPYLVLFLIFVPLVAHYRSYQGGTVGSRVLKSFLEIDSISSPISLNPINWFYAAIVAFFIYLPIRAKLKNKKKFRQGKEYGSARWGTLKT